MINQHVKEVLLSRNVVKKCSKYFLVNLPNESIVFLFGRSLDKKDGKIIIATDPVIPQNEDYASRSTTKCKVSFEFMAREFLQKFKSGKELVISWHSHPINGLSSADKDAHLEMLKGFKNVLTGYFNEGRFEFYQFQNGFRQVKHRIVEMKFFDRQIRAFGYDAQYRLLATHVALIGCGGASQLAYLLAEKGIGKLTLVDPDKWDLTSLNRVWIPRSHVGMNKAKSLQKLLKWRDIEVRAFDCAVENLPPEVLEEADILVAMTDTYKSRIYVNRLAVNMKKPAVFAGSEIRAKDDTIEIMAGNCVVYIPGKTPCYECNLEIDPQRALKELMDRKKWRKFARKYGLQADSPPVPSLASLNTIIVSLVSDEILKIVTGYSSPIHYQYWDHLKRKLIIVEAERRPECPACGEFRQTEPRESDLISTEEALSAGNET